MIKKLKPFLFLLLSIVSCTKQEQQKVIERDNQTLKKGIEVGLIDSLYSKILDQERKLVIYLPESAKSSKRRRNQYPVVYLLDGDYNFVSFVGMLKRYSEMNDTKILPEMIVVGIESIDSNSRMMDFSPTPEGNPEQFGGGDKFLEFIKTELFPYVEQNYFGSKNRTIIGHSFGGLAVMNALTNHPEMFNNYLLIDGSLYFDNNLFLSNPKYKIEGKELKYKNLYVAIANTATYQTDLESIKKDTIRANRYVRHSLKLVEQINSSNTNLNMKWKYYENDTHGSTAFLGEVDGLRFFYSWFEFKAEHKYRTKYFIPQVPKDRFANLVKTHFDSVSKRIGYSFYPDEEWISSNAYMLLNYHKQPNQAREVFELNKEYYPESATVYKDLGDFYFSQKDTINAILNYKKTLEIKDDFSVKEILSKMK